MICQVLIHVLRTHVRIIFISSFISRSFIVLRSSVSMSLYLQWMIINRYVKFSSMSYGPTWELFSYPVSIPLYLQWMTFISYGVHYQYQRSEIRDQRTECTDNIFFLRSSFSSPDQWQSFPIHCPTEYSYSIIFFSSEWKYSSVNVQWIFSEW